MAQRIAVVTGAYGGLGSELCRQIAAAGGKLILVDRNRQKSEAFAADLNKSHPGAVIGMFSVDLTSPTDIRRMSQELLSKYPRIDFLFNNAGVLMETLQLPPQGREIHFEVNTLAPSAIDRPVEPGAEGGTRCGGGQHLGRPRDPSEDTRLGDADEANRVQEALRALRELQAGFERDHGGSGSRTGSRGVLIRAVDPGPNKTRLKKGRGTPLWMRLFYSVPPTPDKGAKKIVDAGLPSKWDGRTGIFVSGDSEVGLPAGLKAQAFQTDFLRKCRDLVGIPDSSAVKVKGANGRATSGAGSTADERSNSWKRCAPPACRPDPSHAFRVGTDDLASVSPIVRSILTERASGTRSSLS